jgi:ADP-heptose:LPS heptosyltransferase
VARTQDLSIEPRVLFLRFGPIGNAVAAIPAVRTVRRAWPHAYLALLADPLTAQLWQECPYLSEVIVYDQKAAHRPGPGYLRLMQSLRRRKFSHSIHLRRFIRSELIGFLAGAKKRIGFESGARIQLLTRKVPYQEGVSVIELGLRLVRELDLSADDNSLEYWPRQAYPRVQQLYDSLAGDGPVVVIHPGGATQRERLWPYYGELGAALQEKYRSRVILLGTSEEEVVLQSTEDKMSGPVGKALGFELGEVAEIIRRAHVFVGTDSGPCHLAAMVGTPGSILYAPHQRLSAQLKKWKPAGEQYLAFTPGKDCADCPEHPCSLERQKECAASIPLAAVQEGVERLLDRIIHYQENRR